MHYQIAGFHKEYKSYYGPVRDGVLVKNFANILQAMEKDCWGIADQMPSVLYLQSCVLIGCTLTNMKFQYVTFVCSFADQRSRVFELRAFHQGSVVSHVRAQIPYNVNLFNCMINLGFCFKRTCPRVTISF